MFNLCGPSEPLQPTFTSVAHYTCQQRSVTVKSIGSSHGPITRLVSPGDIGLSIKPFIFLDLFKMPSGPRSFNGFGWHPHSGIATVTLLLEGSSWYEETTSKGQLDAGGIEFFKAASGAWHTGGPVGNGAITGYQLWISLPAEQELEAPESFYVQSKDVQSEGPARIIMGAYGKATSRVPSPPGINYLDVLLSKNESWTYNVPPSTTLPSYPCGRAEFCATAMRP